MAKRQHRSAMSAWRDEQKAGKSILTPLDFFKRHKKCASGILLLDGKFLNIRGTERCEHLAYDTHIGLVNNWMDDTENSTAYWHMYAELKEAGYSLRAIVSDGHIGIAKLTEEEKIPHQRCVFHLLQDIRYFLGIRNDEISGNWILFQRLRHILLSPTLEKFVENLEFFRKYTSLLFENKKSILKWFYKNLEAAMMHLSFTDGEVPRTSNQIENYIGQVEQRLKTMRGFKSEISAKNTLNAIFTSIRKHPFTHRN